VLGPVSGLRVLDIACGHGRFTRALARRGAEVRPDWDQAHVADRQPVFLVVSCSKA
jgi:2-polyprenyl-3-methyl-5-hydroxy-6-metoxy-1,4-benzoquinol methylase